MIMIKCNLKQILWEKRLTMTEFANKTGLSRSTVSRLYNNKTQSFTTDVLKTCCKFLEITVGEFLEYVPEEVA